MVFNEPFLQGEEVVVTRRPPARVDIDDVEFADSQTIEIEHWGQPDFDFLRLERGVALE